jgi:galactonate dehydratase
MRIVDYDLFNVPPRWLFLRIETSTGLVGWGEPIVEGRAKTVRTAVEELMDSYLLGEDPLRIGDHWQAMYRGGFYRGGPILMSTIAGIDQALWDIKGKHYGAPVYDLLGGRTRDRIRVYQWIGGDRLTDVSNEAASLVDAGYTALKMDATNQMRAIESPAVVNDVVERVRHVRETVGESVDIGVDFRGRVSKTMAKLLIDELAPYQPMFIEEPVLPGNLEHLSDIATNSNIPLATGERLYSRWDFKSLFADGVIDVIQPDVSHAGGISETIKIANMAEAHDIAVAPNCPLGPIALAASLQVGAAIPNLHIQDHGFDIHPISESIAYDYLADPSVFSFQDGYLDVLTDPGLGITPDIDHVETRAAEDIDWHNPIWRNDDGSIAEW